MSLRILVPCLIIFMLLAPQVDAFDFNRTHVVQPGETLAAIAKEYYGDPWRYVYIASANRLRTTADLEVGQKLKIPTRLLHTVRKDDSLSRISEKYYSTRNLVDYLVWANKLNPRAPLDVGQRLKIPFVIRHRVRKSDSLAKIAQRYYRNQKLADEIGKWNDVRTTKNLLKRKYVWLPINLRAKIVTKKVPVTPPIVAKEEASTSTNETSKTDKPTKLYVSKGHDVASFPLVSQLMAEGEFARALAILAEIPRAQLKANTKRIDFYWRVSVCQVALGDIEEAKKNYRRLLRVAGGKYQDELQARLEASSPKMRYIVHAVERESKKKPNKNAMLIKFIQNGQS